MEKGGYSDFQNVKKNEKPEWQKNLFIRKIIIIPFVLLGPSHPPPPITKFVQKPVQIVLPVRYIAKKIIERRARGSTTLPAPLPRGKKKGQGVLGSRFLPPYKPISHHTNLLSV